jgi:hypothetical protein
MQALLAISGFVFGALAAWQLAIGGGLPAAWWCWPIGHSHSRFMPSNNKLMVGDPAFATSQVRQLIKTRGFLHAGKAFSPRNDAGRAR